MEIEAILTPSYYNTTYIFGTTKLGSKKIVKLYLLLPI